MARNRFVDPTASKRLELTEDDWLEVKNSINWGEALRLSAMYQAAVHEGGAVALAEGWDRYKIEEVMTWALDWSFVGADGEKVSLSREALAELDPESGDELLRALNAHVEAQRASPKVTSGEPTLETVSI